MHKKIIPNYGPSWIMKDSALELKENDFTPLFLQGNEACVEGAMLAGLSFYGGYPITPSSEIAEILSRRLTQEGKMFIQMEDEIASIAACIGASIGGAKSMTATSGPGFSLMQENLGYAIMTEVPTVIIDVQRLGPSTGAASSPAQGDVMQARWGTHGDHPILVLAPSSVKECFELTIMAFNFSEQLRTPVIILSDEVVGHMREKILIPPKEHLDITDRQRPNVPPEQYKPYSNASEITPLAPLGEGYRYHITGLLHDEAGFPTNRDDEINLWYDRVFDKFAHHNNDTFLYRTYETEDADTLVISFGISARTARHAVTMAREKGKKAGFLQLLTLWPLNEEFMRQMTAGMKKVIIPEMNRGQLALEIDRIIDRDIPIIQVNRTDGQMIDPQAILEVID